MEAVVASTGEVHRDSGVPGTRACRPEPMLPTAGTSVSPGGEGVEGHGGGRGHVEGVDPIRHRDRDHHVDRARADP